MYFNSIDFAIFLPLVFIFYWFVFNKSIKTQNFFILIVSYVFYSFWDWRFLSLIFISTILDYFIGNYLSKSDNFKIRKRLLILSLLVNLSILGFFKYFNFFVDNFVQTFNFFGYNLDSISLGIILPVGISFYTFQALSYTIDVYRKKIKSSDNFIEFASFVSFFPQLVAGPIERASNLLPQFSFTRKFDYYNAVLGLRQILWGLFKKIVIADNCAEQVNLIFSQHNDLSGSTMLLGAFFFAFQIYGDFSGYSDIAIGVSRLFGFNLKLNFNYPYFSRDVAEFWRRWHISLSTWFRDYLYFPLGGSKVGKSRLIFNVLIVFLVSAFWHGANWTFIAWGLLNAIFILPSFFFNKNRINLDIVAKNSKLPNFKEFINIVFTFFLICLTWIFFRAENITQALEIFANIFSKSILTIPYYLGIGHTYSLIVLIVFFIVIEWLGRREEFAIHSILKNHNLIRILFYYLIIALIILFPGNEQEFIYFQF